LSITGSGSLVQLGPGTLILNVANAYSGSTVISGGSLQIGDAGALGTGGLVANAGTLDLNGRSPTVASLSGSAGRITSNGGSPAALTVNQSITTSFGGSISDGPSSHVSLFLEGSGTLTLSGTSSYTGGTTVHGGEMIVTNADGIYDGTSLAVGDASLLGLLGDAPVPTMSAPVASPTVAAVPEPGTLVLLGAGSALLAFYRKRRSHKRVKG
jgi:autotransporter-associated beta strand protein